MVKLFWCAEGIHDWCSGVSGRTTNGKRLRNSTPESEKIYCECECGHSSLPCEEVYDGSATEDVDVSSPLAEGAAEASTCGLGDVPSRSRDR